MEKFCIEPGFKIEVCNLRIYRKNKIGISLFQIVIMQFIQVIKHMVELKIQLQMIPVKEGCREKGRAGFIMDAGYTLVGSLKERILIYDLLDLLGF